MLKKLCLIIFATAFSHLSFAQILTSMQGGGSTKASVTKGSESLM